MGLLILTSLLWSLSFGLIKSNLSGLDPNFVAAARLAISALVFLPFVWKRTLSGRQVLELMAIGGVQFGLMYLLVIRSYGDLAGWQVALFTILTPLHVVFLESLRSRRWRAATYLAAILAIAGAAWISWPEEGQSAHLGVGFLLVQGANLCFALGQLGYRSRAPQKGSHAASMGWAYLGAVIVAGAVSASSFDAGTFSLTRSQWATLAYLGLLPSGLGFFLWNVGATRVSVATLAVMNNLKVPLAVAVSLLVFREQVDLERLLPGAALFGMALWITRKGPTTRT